ncbi:hypothetical protein [Sphingosinicella sp. BN140058]|uniref:hypothetical protein n=1 Tax=Sphingosinicella sp. BN140058 TaxID=1892855 RepID=UPI001011035C|nr:hypothetical protein [Sphingosinicella sp. BN140058]QAY77931.1 hypothetical protein ETR14_16425 [Sphingosinicella sp. BN140058]
MPSTGRRDLVANRWEPFVHTIDFEGLDLTGAAFKLQVRLYPDAPGAPLVDLATVGSAGTQGVRLLGVETGAGLPISHVSIRINEPVVEGLPSPAEIGRDTDLYYDLQITPVGSDKFRVIEGKFTVHAGVTQ